MNGKMIDENLPTVELEANTGKGCRTFVISFQDTRLMQIASKYKILIGVGSLRKEWLQVRSDHAKWIDILKRVSDSIPDLGTKNSLLVTHNGVTEWEHAKTALATLFASYKRPNSKCC